jgi:hypothetical protein
MVSMLTVVMASYNNCYAPPSIYGPKCKASDWLNGVDGVYVKYTVDILGDVNVECEAVGSGYRKEDGKPWGWYNMGVFTDGDAGTLYWGANMAYPEIRCKGLPLGSGIRWSWSTTDGPDFPQ